MAATQTSDALRVQKWIKQNFNEYQRRSRFFRYTGSGENAVVQLKKQPVSQPGDRITVPFLGRLKGTGTENSNTLEGNEEGLTNAGHQVTVAQLRHAVLVDATEEQKNILDLVSGSKVPLQRWFAAKDRDLIIDRFQSPVVGGVTTYADASEGEKDAFLVANRDRTLFGELDSNGSGGDHSASLALIDSVNDVLKPGVISLAKRLAQTADPHIMPITVGEDEEWFVMFAGPMSMRDLRNDTTMIQANREARERGKDNPLFAAGDLLWDGVIIREVPEMVSIGNVGGSSIPVEANVLCGAQTIAHCVGMQPTPIRDVRDYGDKTGVGLKGWRGIEKLYFQGKQHGCVTVYNSAEADA